MADGNVPTGYTPARAAEFARRVPEAAAGLGLVPAVEPIHTADILVAQFGVDTRPFWTATLGDRHMGPVRWA